MSKIELKIRGTDGNQVDAAAKFARGSVDSDSADHIRTTRRATPIESTNAAIYEHTAVYEFKNGGAEVFTGKVLTTESLFPGVTAQVTSLIPG